MNIPLGFSDINFLLAAQAILLLITLEIISPKYQIANIAIDRKRFRKITLITVVLFSASVIIYLINIIFLRV